MNSYDVSKAVWESVYHSIVSSVREPVSGSVWNSIVSSVWEPVSGSVWNSVASSVKDFARESVKDYFQTNSDIIKQ